ncbi:MAG TPA: hypothetical protein VFM69_15270, partial [Pricia sp.]|nr:hypothetical protein [Pricia sp.]
MGKKNFLYKITVVFFTLNILVTAPSYSLWAGNGPGSPEAAGFEPVNATDMVSLINGDLSYVLPLLSVDGYPVTLSYHAGITTDMDASWVGLGWYLNPGAINRSLAGTPDDWKGGVGIDFTSYYKSQTYYGISVDVGFANCAQVGVGLNWGAGKGLSGTVRASLGFKIGDQGDMGSVSASASSTGTFSIGAGVGIGSYGAGASYSYSVSNKQGSVGVGAGRKTKDGTFIGVGASFSSNGFSIGASVTAGRNSSNTQLAGGGMGMGTSSFNSADMSVESQSAGFAIPIYIGSISVTLGFTRQKVEYSLRKGFQKNKWGALYASAFSAMTSGTSQADAFDTQFNDYQKRTESFDVYSTRLPQPEEEFIGDYSQKIENVNFTSVAYDGYNVSAQGLMGSMSPRIFQDISIFGEGARTTSDGDDIHVFWHHGNMANSADRQFGYGTNKRLYFYFDGQLTSRETVVPSTLTATQAGSNIDSYLSQNGLFSNYSLTNPYKRAKSPNFIEVYTNEQIAQGVPGLVTPQNIPDTDRDNPALFDPDGIGAYKITSADGKTYHFALPVYHFEMVRRGLIEGNEYPLGNAYNVKEKRQYSRYATHWLLTAVTGSDYIDNGPTGFGPEDYGYWVELEYGKWSDGYVWRTPYNSQVKRYNTNLLGNIEEKDKGFYQFGRKQLYYLDKIRTRNRTAIFVKDIRYDAVGKELDFSLIAPPLQPPFDDQVPYHPDGTLKTTGGNDGMNHTDDIYIKETGVHYKREYSLKLEKIVLLQTEVADTLVKYKLGSLGNSLSGYVRDDSCSPGWESPDFKEEYNPYDPSYSYTIHNEANVFDVNDISQQTIDEYALKVIEFNQDYTLAKQSPSSSELPPYLTGGTRGKLTLNSVTFKGRGGAYYMPPYKFDYYMESMPNLSLASIDATSPSEYVREKRESLDNWGFLKGYYPTSEGWKKRILGWNLKEITTPTGAKINIDYQEDDYWIEAFGRRFWQQGLQFRFYELNDKMRIKITKQAGNTGVQDLNFSDYFKAGEKTFIDIWACVRHDYNDWGCESRKAYVDIPGEALDVIYANYNQLVLETTLDYLTTSNGNPLFNKNITLNGGPGMIAVSKPRGECGNPPGCINVSDRLVLMYKLLANKVPVDETGGGLRVSQLSTTDITTNTTYITDYNYDNPITELSSGITSYAPVDGLKYVPYQSELPAPGVMYEYVTVTEKTADNGDFDSQTRYRHHVLQPVFDIFDPNISMKAMDADGTEEDAIFWASVTNDAVLNGSDTYDDVLAKKIDISVNSALIGQIKSIENLNSEGQVLLRIENDYINGRNLISGPNNEPNKGYITESFNSMKTVFYTNDEGTDVDEDKTKRLLSISTKTEYNNMLKRVTTYSGNQEIYTEYDDVDPWLGSFRKSISKQADGTFKQNYRVPAYTYYSDLESKAENPSNKNMLSQQAMDITEVGPSTNGPWATINASISTWSDSWTYRDEIGVESGPSTEIPVWRKHTNFVWKEGVTTDGTYLTNIDESNTYFNWGTGAPTNNKWQKTSEITRYNHYSLALEVKDINDNYVASRMSADNTKVLISGNAQMTEMYFSGAERVLTGNRFEGEVLGANYRTQGVGHTGNYFVVNNDPGDKVFELNFSAGQAQTMFREGMYKASFWAGINKGDEEESAL